MHVYIRRNRSISVGIRYLLQSLALALTVTMTGCASAPDAKSNQAAKNTQEPVQIVQQHLRALEQGNWQEAEGFLSSEFEMQMKGMPWFKTIGRANALDMHRARKQAFPDFKFNEKIAAQTGNSVKIAVYLTGTHTGYLDYPIDDVPKLQATGRSIDLPAEYFTYYVEGNRIRYIFGEIPDGHGPPALKKQLGVE